MFTIVPDAKTLDTLTKDLLRTSLAKAKKQSAPLLASLSLELKHWDDLGLLNALSKASVPFLYHHTASTTHLFAGQLLKHISSGKAPRFAEAKAFFEALKTGYTSYPAAYPLHLACAFHFLDSPHKGSLECFIPQWHFSKNGYHSALHLYLRISPESSLEACEDHLQKALAFIQNLRTPDLSPSLSLRLSESNVEQYPETVTRALEFLNCSPYKKITLAAYQDYVLEGAIDFASLFQKLKREEPASTLFCWSADAHSSFFGASPETLVRASGKTIFVDALAGSSVRSNKLEHEYQEQEQLLQDPKVLEEHRYVVDAILDALSALGLEALCSSKTSVKALKHLYHLFTSIEAKMKANHNFFDTIDALHPTPALGTYPKSKDYSCIQALEGFERKLYGGGLGWMHSENEGHITVNIRCAQLDKDSLRFFAGCGLTASSVPKIELQELQTKLKTLLKHFIP